MKEIGGISTSTTLNSSGFSQKFKIANKKLKLATEPTDQRHS